MPTPILRLPERKTSCKVTFTNWNKTVECKPHTNLRELALEHDIDLYNGLSRFFNCEGHGLCGTCTVEVTPPEGGTVKRAKEKFRFLLLKGNLRLACQMEVTDDIQVTKHTGLKGNKEYREALSRDEAVRLYREEGQTLDQIAERFQCPVPKLVNLLEKAGVEMRRPGSAA